MARKRLSTPGYITSTKGHSVLRNKWGYGGRAMSPVDDLYLSDIYRPRHATYYDTTGTENEIRRNVNRELLFSTHAADDAYEVAAKSRNRDQEILREATNAIVNTETHASPKAAVASRRARSHSHFTYHHPTAAPKSYLPPKAVTISTPSHSYVRRPRKESTTRTTYTRGGKAIRDVDGFTQPKNVLSWQYRIESRVDPEDVIEMPKTYAAVRKQMEDVQCKMDKHRQLMDRYLEPDLKPETEDVKSKIMNLYVDMEQRNPSLFRATGESVTSSSTEHKEISTSVRATSVRPPPVSFAPATKYHRDDSEYSPMSDVRRRVRSVIRKNKRAASVL